MNKKKLIALLGGLLFVLLLGGCSKGDAANGKVTIYTNADEEPVEVIKNVLDKNGYKGKYTLQSFGTSELGGKLLAEGKDIEADLVTMSTFYLNSAQKKEDMFKKLELPVDSLTKIPDYIAPFTVQEGTIFYNTDVMKEMKLPVPASLKDLADPKYKDALSISDIKQSSTAWLLFQALVDNYGQAEAKTILQGIYKNAGDHLESSGSGPLKKVRLGEVAIGFGLRHQAVKDKQDGLPIDFVEPTEGTYTLTESLAVIDKGKNTNPEAEKMLNLILEKGRKDLLEIYPSALYKGETVDPEQEAKDQKVFPNELTAELLEKHQKLVD
ncbi:extracellular solute-binding protein [Candidatus Enterococcus murrayae]|uniref:Extracellular solute-binding protein n=1 Tax=Candidatus Enterococcus murrayae TaxID=2815321 RepID=A0ABS3HHH4_9ENTE|nr:extracellular solute-binding protein [Enterococcus sp. MJM16]MBO0452908.1 extracellular solute-binding protein [Enterococcus sp. MJM16]